MKWINDPLFFVTREGRDYRTLIVSQHKANTLQVSWKSRSINRRINAEWIRYGAAYHKDAKRLAARSPKDRISRKEIRQEHLETNTRRCDRTVALHVQHVA